MVGDARASNIGHVSVVWSFYIVEDGSAVHLVAMGRRNFFKPIVSTRRSARCQRARRAAKELRHPGELLQHARPRRDLGGVVRSCRESADLSKIKGRSSRLSATESIANGRVTGELCARECRSRGLQKRLVDAKRVQNGQPHDNMANRALFYVPLEKGDAFAKSNSIPLNATSWRHRHIDKSSGPIWVHKRLQTPG